MNLSKSKTPELRNLPTVQQEVIKILPTTLAEATPIHNCKAPSPQIITCENLPHAAVQTKKDTWCVAFTPQKILYS